MSTAEFSDRDVAGHWNANADAWAREVRQGHDVAREQMNNPAFLQLLGDLRDRDVLDAGCGEGYNTRLLARAGARMTGVDISERMIALAAEEERAAPLGIRYVCTAYTRLGMFAPGSFDAVVSFMAFMDGPGFDQAMTEIFRVLRPGGTLSFSITHPCFIVRGGQWMRDERGVKVAWIVRNYFTPLPWVDRWRFTDAPADAPEFSVPRFDRTLSEYVNAVLAAGFRLTRLEEPRPSEEYCQAHPSQRGWRDHAALFLHVQATKPA
ncbi:MAG TPA: class I SAM-dependent methyltransferase [Candidatus Bathyarchaeia archaeon]|nr:class I SAM-dependent methyltransferase [Candidatus Bathyarchaeia archaeon]